MTAAHALTSAVGLIYSCRTVHTVGAYTPTQPEHLQDTPSELVYLGNSHHPELISTSRRTPPPPQPWTLHFLTFLSIL